MDCLNCHWRLEREFAMYRLAKDSAKFTDAYAACPVCSPTRASILTGQWPQRPGITDYIGAPSAAVRRGDWKLIEWQEDNRAELFILAADLGEQTNLAAKEPQRVAQLRAELHAWQKQVGAKFPIPNPTDDPGERTDVSAAHPEVVQHLTSQLDKLVNDGRSRPQP